MSLNIGSYDLSRLDFIYDPFAHLDASQDPYLFDYLVPPRDAAIAWEDVHALVFAPRGGGKTALRQYAEDNCLNQTLELKFPVTYIPGNFDPNVDKRPGKTRDNHLKHLCKAVATDIFRHFLWKPERFLQLTEDIQGMIVRAFEAYITNPTFSFLLEILGTDYSAREVATSIDRFRAPQTHPTQAALRELHRLLAATRGAVIDLPCPQLEDLFDLIVGPLGSQSVHIFTDGLDAFPETNHNPERIARWIIPLLDLMTQFSKPKVFLKLFLPMEVKAYLRSARQAYPSVTLAWDDDFLVEILQSRISAASGNKFESLDAKSSPYLRGVEAQIVAGLPRKLPREALEVTKKIIEISQKHWGVEGYITHADVEQGTRLFKYEYDLRRPKDKTLEVGTS